MIGPGALGFIRPPHRKTRFGRPSYLGALGLSVVMVLLAKPAPAQTWYPGVADTTLGRFGAWPEFPDYDPTHDNKYEDNLVCRIWPDRVQRTVSGQFYELEFGARSAGETPTNPSVSIAERNWVHKTINVFRGPSFYRLAYNSLSPGFHLSSFEDHFYLVPPEAFAHTAFMGSGGAVVQDLSAPSIDGTFYQRSTDGDWTENWMLVWTGDTPALGAQVPILLVFTHHPKSLRWWGGELIVEFDKPGGVYSDVLCTFLDGVGSRTPGEVANWDTVFPAAVEDKCRLLSRTLIPFPKACQEEFSLDETAGTVTIRNTFTYGGWNDHWGTPVNDLAPLPPLAAYARSRGYPVTVNGSLVDLETPTKLGPYQALLGVNQIEYTLPLAPLWTVNLVPTTSGSVWFDRARGQAEGWASSLVWDFGNSPSPGAWFLGIARGMFESFLVCDPPTRDFYLRVCRDILDQLLLNFSSGPWHLRQVPGTDLEYHYLLHFSSGTTEPKDQDTSSGAPLEFLYQYALYTGDWDYIASRWSEVQNIFQYLAIVNDWAWMASSARDYGAGGAFFDMFPSQWMGYVSYAKLARMMTHVIGPEWDERADFAHYLASKAMIPLTQRLDFRDGYASQHYDFTSDLVCNGFGEYEPNPHPSIPGFWCGAPVGSMIGYQAQLLSGEDFHPLVFEAYRRWVPADLLKVVQLGYDVNGGTSYVLHDAAYPFSKMYAYNVVGWDRGEVDQMWSDMHIEDSFYKRLVGPPNMIEHGFLHAYQVCRDLPVWAVGSWEPARMLKAEYDEAAGILTCQLTNDGAVLPNAELTVLSKVSPVDVRVDDESVPFVYDADWQTVRVTVAGPGHHRVEVEVPAAASAEEGPEKSAAHYSSNRVQNGDFEETYLNPNWSRAWKTWSQAQTDNPLIEGNIVHSGEYALKFHVSGSGDQCNTHQNIFVGPYDSYRIRFWYNVPTALQANWHFAIVSQEYNEDNPAAESWRSHSIPGFHSPTAGWEFAEIVVPPDPSLPDAAIVRLHLRLENDVGTVYVDDLELIPVSQIGVPGSDEPGPGGTPSLSTRLLACHPNPSLGTTNVSLFLEQEGPLEIEVYDIQGRRVAVVHSGARREGDHQLVWNGRDTAGRVVPSGLYFMKMQAGEYRGVQRILLLD